jgi:hypothetical protein
LSVNYGTSRVARQLPGIRAMLRSAAWLGSLSLLLVALPGCSDRVPASGVERGDASDPTTPPDDPDQPDQKPNDFLPHGPVIVAEPPPPPIQGGTLLVLNDGLMAVASDPDRDRIYVVDLNLKTLRSDLPVDPGDQPGRAVQDNKGFVHVVLRRGGAIVRVNPLYGTVDLRRAVCPAPSGIAYDAKRDLLHVACETGELVSIASTAMAPQAVLDLGRDLRDVGVGLDGNIWVTRFRSAELILVRDGSVVTKTLLPIEAVPESVCPMGATRQAGAAWRLSLNGAMPLMLHQRMLDLPAGYYGPPPCPNEHRVGAALTTFSNTGAPSVTTPIPNATTVTDVAQGAGRIALAITGHSWGPTARGNVRVWSPASSDAPVDYHLPGEITAVGFGAGRPVAQSREPAALFMLPTAPGDSLITIPLSKATRFDTGLALFHLDSGIGIACASCHPAARDDGHTWLFSIGLRRTQSLAQRLAETAPYHWDGKITTLHDFMDDVFTARMFGAKLGSEQNAALQHWVESPRLAPKRTAGNAAAVQRGKALFEGSAQCTQCHSGANFTNNMTFDVGTGMPAQVPSLLGVGARLPLMHTGCAKTLAERFNPKCGGASHGETQGLAAGDIADLVAYLDSL